MPGNGVSFIREKGVRLVEKDSLTRGGYFAGFLLG